MSVRAVSGRRSPLLGVASVVVAAMLTLGACSSGTSTAEAPGTSSEPATTTSVETTTEAAPTVAPTTAAAPATTAQPPVAFYPEDPSQEPVVVLGPPPAGYVVPRPECPPEAKACIDLTNSMTWLQSDGAVIYGPVQHIAGRRDYRTTPGMHEVFWKNIDHVSSIFGTPMPYAIFFTKSGMAFHEGSLTEPSHGCIHLTHDAVVTYWDNLHPGDRVYVFGEAQY